MRNAVGDPGRLVVGRRAGNDNLDELGRPFAVAHDRLRSCCATSSSAARNAGSRGSSRPSIGARPLAPVATRMRESLVDVSPSTVMRLNDASAIAAVSSCHKVGATATSVAMKRAWSPYSAGSCLRLGNAGHGDRPAVQFDQARDGLRHGVRRHDRFRRLRPVRSSQPLQRRWQSCQQPWHGQRFHDHAGGKGQHLRSLAAQQPCHLGASRARIGQPGRPGSGIGATRVDDQARMP